ncbi:MAG: patatin-like phospholipase family protein [Bacteroidales bacterium]|nr:patatin-like phospholipase family protein [Bacteroidales bacterium]
MKKEVALVLSSGGPRGFAYIGAIEELERRGYRITSIAGTSIGSLIGGIHAAGRLNELKAWLYDLDSWKVFTLMDLSIGKNHLLKGDKLIHAIKQIVPEIDIEDLRIPFKAVATDLYTGEEVVFDSGSLFQAIRASISIPSLFRPVRYGYRTLIDGGIANTLPLNRVHRNGNDILVAFNVNDVDVDEVRKNIIDEANQAQEKAQQQKELDARTKAVMDSIRHNPSMTFLDKMKLAGQQGRKVIEHAINDNGADESHEMGENYYGILTRTFSLMNHVNSKLAAELYRPDILVNMPFDAYGDISDYAKADEIAEAGRTLMKTALDRYEDEHSTF